MDIEKLIEQLNEYFEGKELGRGAALDAATALSTFQAENEKLRAELSQIRESLDFARTKDSKLIRLGMELAHLKKHMERLTHRLGNGEITCNMARDDCRKMGGDCQIDSKILDRLAAYEETGLEPEEIELLAKQRTLPAADVAEVRHERWERVLTASGIITRVRCSGCAEIQPLTFENIPYCPLCGARMDGKDKHEALLE